jgi:hypothetical protein
MDNVWEQEKLEATKMLENGDETHMPKRSEVFMLCLAVLMQHGS